MQKSSQFTPAVAGGVRASESSGLNMNISLRKAKAEDADFAFQVIKETMRDYAIQTWGSWHAKESKEDAILETMLGSLEIIIYQGCDIGTLQKVIHADNIQIEKIYILPKYQNKGIGSQVLADVMKLAKTERKCIKLEVLQVNRAKELYSRLGFNILDENNERVFLQYTP